MIHQNACENFSILQEDAKEVPKTFPTTWVWTALTIIVCLSTLSHTYRPIPSTDAQRKIPAGLPQGLIHQDEDEAAYLKLHRCRNGGEAYSAAYLTSREHLQYQNTVFNLSMVNCEMGSFIMMYPPHRNYKGKHTHA